MEIVYWVLIGVLVALVAKVQIPTQKEENMPMLMVLGILGAVVTGWLVHTFARSGFMGMSWVAHLAALLGATLIVLGMRVATHQHLA